MKYIDSGSRDRSHAFAKWLETVLSEDVSQLRLQSGFFSLDGASLLIPTLKQGIALDQTTNILIGSNDSNTLRNHVEALMNLMGIPRKNARLGVVYFSGAFFHPKTYHVYRKDGSQAAFVGSANLTASGLALHVEAGITLDTREGDSAAQLSQIADAIDGWFDDKRAGLNLITGTASIDELVKNGVLSLTPPPKPATPNTGAGASSQNAQPHLKPLFAVPHISLPSAVTPAHKVAEAPAIPAALPTAPAVVFGKSAPRPGFPPYLLFDPAAVLPTSGVQALTGSSLPNAAVGLIIQLNKDSARHFMGGSGTANISIPAETAMTLRFGVYGKHHRPRAEYLLRLRYLTASIVIDGGTANTNVMGYGFVAGESGHGDVRLLVPADVRGLAEAVKKKGLPVPTVGDLVLLEWPQPSDAIFRLTFLEQKSPMAVQARNLYQDASVSGNLVGNGASWLVPGLSEKW
jgi:hypothetical protein